MPGKIILNLAMSLDGYIATRDDRYNWIVGSGALHLNTPERHDFQAFLDTVDIVVMGKRCYDLGMHKDFSSKTVYVVTHQALESSDSLIFIDDRVVSTMEHLRDEGKTIYLFGGGQIVDLFLKQNTIDEFIVGVIPIVLGKGIPLFLGETSEIPLHLDSMIVEDGIVILHYRKRSSID